MPVERLMRAEGMRGIPEEDPYNHHRRRPGNHTSGGSGQAEVLATGPNQLSVAGPPDAERTHPGWTCVALVLDVFSRMTVGWHRFQ